MGRGRGVAGKELRIAHHGGVGEYPQGGGAVRGICQGAPRTYLPGNAGGMRHSGLHPRGDRTDVRRGRGAGECLAAGGVLAGAGLTLCHIFPIFFLRIFAHA